MDPGEGDRGSGGLVGLMAFDWTIRAMLAGVVGIVGALIAAGLGAWGYVVLFVLVSVAGWGLFAYMTTHAP